MTRINVVPVEELCDQHLLAEHRELTRIPNGLLSGKLKVVYDDRPSEYTLGPGHVKFFTNKLPFLLDRYLYLHYECLRREFDVKWIFPRCGGKLDQELFDRWWRPKPADLALNRARIKERWPKNARYFGKPYSFNKES